MPEVEKLLTLQERDQRIRAFELELNAIPDERRFKERQIADSATRLEAAKTRMKGIEVERNKLQVEAQAKRDSIAKYKTQQFQTRKNEEFAALGHEIATAEKAIVAIEDRELELMEEAEGLRPVVAEAERAHTEERAKLEAQIAELGRKAETIQARVAELIASRPALAEGLDEDLLDQYTRLFKSKNGSALVELDHDVCTGCHMKVTTQTSVAVKGDKALVHCPNCGRILHLPA
ncbi:MAG: C4-type zinc ribbon domain-containing protein [Terrimicrobiaceae bacterium]|nr:C4-type zinc ribbon domain-containing protein [Terrimicrobiaceae bacterium]